jgi:shikimate dehydrogenase
MITGHTRLLPILADPIGHVRTPEVFNAYLARIGVDALVIPAHVHSGDLRTAVDGLRSIESVAAMIVTVPHKIAMVELCDELDASARLMGAVNIVRRDRGGRLTGANFDGAGMASALAAELGPLAGKRAYVAGAGGVARAIAFALAQAGVAHLAIHNRSTAKADALIDGVKHAFPAITAMRGGDRPADVDIAINATSVGLHGDAAVPFEVDALPATAAVAEVVMNPPLTPLLRRAQARGLRIVKGDAMLHCQLAAWVKFLGFETENTR